MENGKAVKTWIIRNEQSIPGNEDGQETHSLAMPVGSGSEGGKDDENDGGDEQGIDTRPLVRQITKEELADNCASKGNRRDIFNG